MGRGLAREGPSLCWGWGRVFGGGLEHTRGAEASRAGGARGRRLRRRARRRWHTTPCTPGRNPQEEGGVTPPLAHLRPPSPHARLHTPALYPALPPAATLMNKGLEVIEAHYLYGADYDHIEIVIHPQSIIHSMVETADSSVLAQVGVKGLGEGGWGRAARPSMCERWRREREGGK